jgi:hypothetical protein
MICRHQRSSISPADFLAYVVAVLLWTVGLHQENQETVRIFADHLALAGDCDRLLDALVGTPEGFVFQAINRLFACVLIVRFEGRVFLQPTVERVAADVRRLASPRHAGTGLERGEHGRFFLGVRSSQVLPCYGRAFCPSFRGPSAILTHNKSVPLCFGLWGG